MDNIDKIIEGDALLELRRMPDECVDCIITSPPYYGLRDYNIDGQIGLENTYSEFIEKILKITKELKRVLKKSGTLWWNHGDSYSGNSSFDPNGRQGFAGQKTRNIKKGDWIPEKSLMMQPHRIAMRMVDDQDWILRNTIIWHKKNSMPSSVTDRLNNKYEFVFFFTKEKRYYFDLDSIRIPFETSENRPDGVVRNRENNYNNKFNAKKGTKWHKQEEDAKKFKTRRPPQRDMYGRNPKGKNPGDVFSLTLQPHPDAHVAMFPKKLISPMIKAGCPDGGIVLDPFMGSGTTAVTARELGRHYIGIELNPEYIKIAEKRLSQQVLI